MCSAPGRAHLGRRLFVVWIEVWTRRASSGRPPGVEGMAPEALGGARQERLGFGACSLGGPMMPLARRGVPADVLSRGSAC